MDRERPPGLSAVSYQVIKGKTFADFLRLFASLLDLLGFGSCNQLVQDERKMLMHGSASRFWIPPRQRLEYFAVLLDPLGPILFADGPVGTGNQRGMIP